MGNCRDGCLGDNSEWDGNVSLNGELIGWDTAPSQGQPSRGGHVPRAIRSVYWLPAKVPARMASIASWDPSPSAHTTAVLPACLRVCITPKAMSSLRHQTPSMFWLHEIWNEGVVRPRRGSQAVCFTQDLYAALQAERSHSFAGCRLMYRGRRTR